jgi:diguanylate cyclase (GGDEF)-like protein
VAAAGDASKRALSWAFDVAIMAAGLLIGVVTFWNIYSDGHLDVHWVLALALGVPVATLMSRFPLVMTRSASGIEIGFESAVLVFLACFDGGHGALAVWIVSQVLSQATTTKRTDIRLFNIGLGVVAGAAAIATMTAISDLDSTSPRELLAIGAGCAVFFLVDYLVSAVSISLEDRSAVSEALRRSSGLAALGVFVAFDSLGYLAALVVRELPAWSAGLLAVPLVTILVATRALSHGFEHRRRLAALFDAAAEAQVVPSRQALKELLARNARAAVAHTAADLRVEGPQEREIGARVRSSDGMYWLVAPAVHRARATVEGDRKALEALATVGEEAFARLTLTAEMAHLARHDALTALPNRTLFLDRVEQAVRRSRRTNTMIAVMFLDLDGFKGVNDRFGHAEGDELLKTVAERLLDCVREADSVARLGGDEFAVLVEDVAHVDELESLCRRLLTALRGEISITGHDIVVGASIGLAVADPDDDAAILLRNADMAMYRAKALGKDRFSVYQPALREENLRRLELVESLRGGLEAHLVVHYQPVVDLRAGRITGMEALVRWRRGDRLVPPDEFIAAAEESGLITELGERVLTQVVVDAAALQAAAGGPISLGVNMSAHQLRDSGFVELVGAAQEAMGANQLVLEMTETVVVANDVETRKALQNLKAHGALLAIDDFGVGFSSIGYLRHLPVDILKIDRSFTWDMDSNERAVALVEAILVMGAALDLRVVAEGIERPGQLARLRALGCESGQGFLFGRPQPVGEAARTIRAGLPATALLGFTVPVG